MPNFPDDTAATCVDNSKNESVTENNPFTFFKSIPLICKSNDRSITSLGIVDTRAKTEPAFRNFFALTFAFDPNTSPISKTFF